MNPLLLIRKTWKTIYTIVCAIIVIYQIINVTIEYLSFPTEITLTVNDSPEYELPSVSVCTKKSAIWKKTAIIERYPNISHHLNFIWSDIFKKYTDCNPKQISWECEHYYFEKE